jgi:hypothetical protein
MENKNHDPDAATHHVIAKPENESKKSGVFAAIRHLLETPKPAIKALFALAEVQSPSPPPPQHESLRNAGISRSIALDIETFIRFGVRKKPGGRNRNVRTVSDRHCVGLPEGCRSPAHWLPHARLSSNTL